VAKRWPARNFAIISHERETPHTKLLLYGGAIQQAGSGEEGEHRKITPTGWSEKQRGILDTSQCQVD